MTSLPIAADRNQDKYESTKAHDLPADRTASPSSDLHLWTPRCPWRRALPRPPVVALIELAKVALAESNDDAVMVDAHIIRQGEEDRAGRHLVRGGNA